MTMRDSKPTERTVANAGPCRICDAKPGEECRSIVDGTPMGVAVHSYGERFTDEGRVRA
jgi:hypothetical protein